jgi:tripartite-type tricarboxylate transporter receptor subunit TctC
MTIADSGPISGPLSARKLRALAITTDQRDPAFPDVPTLAEAGVSGMAISLWTGLVAPAGTPPEIVARLNKAVGETLAMADVRMALEKIAVTPRGTTPEQYRLLIARDAARWKAVATAASIKLE